MSFMDKVKKATQDVAAEAKKATTQAQEKIGEVQTRRKMDESAKALGYLIHAERTKGTPAGPEADRLVGEITALEAQIAAGEETTGAAGYAAPQPEATAADPAPPPPPGPVS